MEEELNKGFKPHNWDYKTRTESYLKDAQLLNTQLRTVF